MMMDLEAWWFWYSVQCSSHWLFHIYVGIIRRIWYHSSLRWGENTRRGTFNIILSMDINFPHLSRCSGWNILLSCPSCGRCLYQMGALFRYIYGGKFYSIHHFCLSCSVSTSDRVVRFHSIEWYHWNVCYCDSITSFQHMLPSLLRWFSWPCCIGSSQYYCCSTYW